VNLKQPLFFFVAVLLCCIVHADVTQANDLIPARLKSATDKWKTLSREVGYEWKKVKQEDIYLETKMAHPLYQYSDESIELDYDSCTGESNIFVKSLPRLMSDEEIKVASKAWLDKDSVVSKAKSVMKRLLPVGKLTQINMMEMYGRANDGPSGPLKRPDANIAKVFFEEEKDRSFGPSILRVSIDKASGKVQAIGLIELPNLAFEAACPSEQAKTVGNQKQKLIDSWMLCKEFFYNGSSDDPEYFDEELKKSISMGEFEFNRQERRITVIHNDETIDMSLFYPPQAQGGTALVYEKYFTSFNIQVKQQAGIITLAGGLPDKGKKAELSVGQTTATIGGKSVRMSGAPQLMNGRLYLPYDLLSLCNGILTRFESKKNTMWIDTRFLRN